MDTFIGLDVSQRFTAVCIINSAGKRLYEGKVLTLPSDIHGWIASKGIEPGQVKAMCLEAGSMSSFLYKGLCERGYAVTCVESRQAALFLKTQRNKTDKNDARGLAQFIRIGGEFVRTVVIRNVTSQEDRVLLTLRQNYVSQKVAIENAITGVLKPFGLIVRRGHTNIGSFCTSVAETIAKAEDIGLNLRESILESLDTYKGIANQLENITKRIRSIAQEHPVCRRLMTAPGVGPVIALSFVTAVDTPERFHSPEDIGAYFGLTPKKFQSGETDINGAISRMGNTMTRMHLVQAATVLLYHSKKWSSLRVWGLRIAKKRGYNIARVAVARKLAIVLHRMWINEQDFRCAAGTEPANNDTAPSADLVAASS